MPKRDKDLLTNADVQALLGAMGKGLTGIRNRAAVTLAWRTGARVSEMSDVAVKDVDLDGGTFRIQHGKGDKMRTLGLDAHTIAAIQLWMAARKERTQIKLQSPLFCTLKGERVSRQYWGQMLKRTAARIGLQKRIHPHALRDAFTIGMLKDGFNLREIQLALGHANSRTTSIYLEALGDAELLEKMRSRSIG